MYMEAQLDQRLPILEIKDDCIVSKQGDLTIGLEITKPEIFTLSSDNYETLHQAFVKALKVLPVGSVFHMQDIYVKDAYQADYDRVGGASWGGLLSGFLMSGPFCGIRVISI
jgi:hypothetical protein